MKRIALLLVLLVSACAGVSPGKFTPVSSASWFDLEREYTWVAVKANAFHPDVINGLAPGRYLAVFEDDSYVYYQGPAKCVLPFTDNGGIRLPKPGVVAEPLLWVYVRDDSAAISASPGGGPLVAAVSKLEAGRVRPFNGGHVDEGLVASIRIQR
jgi:hypothetical protein